MHKFQEKPYTFAFLTYALRAQVNISLYLKKKKSTMFRKKSLFFFTREKSYILVYIFFRNLGMTFRDLRFRDLRI